jgi:nicotinate-nucleotide adenylyltransferase
MTAASGLALFGTSADPPTRGHQALLEGLTDRFAQLATWASDNPSKQHAIPLEKRLELLSTLVQSMQAPRLQLVQELSSPYAITTLQRAEERWPGLPLSFVVGSDLTGQIPRWKDAASLLQRCRLVIVPRQGWPLQHQDLDRLRSLGGQVEILPLTIPATASSSIRQRPAADQIPAALHPLLLKQNFYGFAPGSS